MPDTIDLIKRMTQCRDEMFALLLMPPSHNDRTFTVTTIQLNELGNNEVTASLNDIDQYYQLRFLEKKMYQDSVLEEYQTLVETMRNLKAGTITVDNSLKVIKKFLYKRETEVVVTNLLNMCALLFWMTTTLTSIVFCLEFSIPLIFFNPILGITLTLGAIAIILATTIKSLDCFRKFESFDTVIAERKREGKALACAGIQYIMRPNPTPEAESSDDFPPESHFHF